MRLVSILSLLVVVLARALSTAGQLPADPQRKKPGPDRVTVVTTHVSGVVTDKSGAVLPNVQVTLKLPDGSIRTKLTDVEGRYRFDGVAVGQNYSLRFALPGFRVIERPIRVDLGQTSPVNMQLESGSIPTPQPSPPPSPTANPSPAVSPSPPASPVPVGTDWEGMIQAEEQKLRESKIVFNPPKDMQEQQIEKIEARISFEDIGPALTQGLQGRGEPQVETLKVSPIMKVTLTGDPAAFHIAGTGEEQVVAGKPFGEWEWYVTPLQSGDQSLTLTATATIFLPGRGEKPIYYKTLEKPIRVHVDSWKASKRFVANNWQWLWAVVVVPGAGLFWGLRKKKRRKKSRTNDHEI